MNKHRKKLLLTIQLCSIALLALFVTASASAQTSDTASAHADSVTPPPVPANIEAPPQTKAFLVGHAVGTQNYVCLPSASSASGVAWTLFTPQATLFNDHGWQVTTHFFGPNPFEGGVVRAVWQHSRDTSTVWGRVARDGAAASSDPNFVRPGAIPWLLVEVVGAQAGPTGGDKLTGTTFIQRLNTVGGAAPSTGCSLPTEVGAKAFVPYTADYFFYKDVSEQSRDDY